MDQNRSMHRWLVVLVVACGSDGTPKKRGFTFTQVKPDIYHAVATDDLVAFCNAAIVINRDDVLIVDSHVTPHAARTLLHELKEITKKPVRYVVNTHFHFDHVGGNSVYPPSVEIIGHDLTYRKVADGSALKGRGYDRFIGGIPAGIAE